MCSCLFLFAYTGPRNLSQGQYFSTCQILWVLWILGGRWWNPACDRWWVTFSSSSLFSRVIMQWFNNIKRSDRNLLGVVALHLLVYSLLHISFLVLAKTIINLNGHCRTEFSLSSEKGVHLQRQYCDICLL